MIVVRAEKCFFKYHSRRNDYHSHALSSTPERPLSLFRCVCVIDTTKSQKNWQFFLERSNDGLSLKKEDKIFF